AIPGVERFVALEGAREGWLGYEELLARAPAGFERPEIAERDLLTINYTSGTTSRPKGVMITHRNAYINAIGTLVHVQMTCADRRGDDRAGGGGVRLGDHAGLRADRDRTVHHHLRAAPGARAAPAARAGDAQGAAGGRIDHLGGIAGGRRGGARGAARRPDDR